MPPRLRLNRTSGRRSPGCRFVSPDRPQADLEQDARRHSRAVLGFLGVKPGMHVIDVFSAGGYNTELLARTVGVKGQVIAYNNPAYAAFAEKGIAARYANGRLGNVRQVTAEVGALELAPSSLDAALFVMSYHDASGDPRTARSTRRIPRNCWRGYSTRSSPGASWSCRITSPSRGRTEGGR